MIGTTRSRVSFFMNKFRKLGFIEYNGKLEVHNSLLNVVLYDKPQIKSSDLSATPSAFHSDDHAEAFRRPPGVPKPLAGSDSVQSRRPMRPINQPAQSATNAVV